MKQKGENHCFFRLNLFPALKRFLYLGLDVVCINRIDQFLYAVQLWQIHNAEQMILDDIEANPDKYDGKKLSELTDDIVLDEENIEYTKVKYKKSLVPKMIVVCILLVL